MKILLFAGKRVLGSRAFVIMLAVYAAAIFAASLPGAAGSAPPAGVYCADDSAAAGRIVSYLTENGFILCDNEDSLRTQVEQGELDCGIILPDGLFRMIEAGDTGGCVTVVAGPLSLVPQLYQSHAAAALYKECAPYIAARQLEELPGEELLEEYERRFESGYVFSFELLTVDGAALREINEPTLMMAAAALLLFALLIGTGADTVGRDLLLRIGVSRALWTVLLPGVLARGFLAAAAGSIGLLLAGEPELIAPLAAYTTVLCALVILLAAVMPEQHDRHILLAVLLIASLALCPVFGDITVFSPLLQKVRWLLPPWWFYSAAEHWSAWAAAGGIGMAVACGAVCARWYCVSRYILTKHT